MYIKDFEYAGRMLSEFDCCVCCINSNPGTDPISYGAALTWSTIKVGNKFVKTSASYDAPYSTILQIAKLNCSGDSEMTFSDIEVVAIEKWLRRKMYMRFKPLYGDDSYYNVYYMAAITDVQPIFLAGDVIGFEIQIQTNSGSAYYEEEEYKNNKKVTIVDSSDDYGKIYPYVEIECLKGGRLELSNSLMDRKCIVDNVSAGDIITFSGDTKLITSTNSDPLINHDELYDDFNWVFPEIINDHDEFGIENNTNVFETSINANILIRYSPIARVGIS